MLRSAIQPKAGPSDRHGLIRAIHAIGRELQLPGDARKELQQNLVGVESCAAMSVTQLKTIYSRLSVLAHDAGLRKPVMRKRRGKDERQPEELLSIEQGRMIMHFFDDLEIVGVGQARMNFCKRTCGRVWPQTRAEGNQIIEALKHMRNRGWTLNKGTRPLVNRLTE